MSNVIQNFTNLISANSGGFNWYGFLIGGGMVLCIVIAYFISKKRGYYTDLVIDLALCCIPLAIVGARMGYIIFDVAGGGSTWAEWPLKRILGLDGGGLSGLMIYGGLIAAVAGSLIVIAIQKKHPEHERVSWIQMADLGFTVIILGQVIGRWGNFANQEAYGNLVTDKSLQFFPYAVFIEAKNAWYQATFFYESFWNAIGFVFLMWFYNGKRKSFDGFNFAFYCIWYGFGRFFIEGLRSDSLYTGSGFRVSQLISIAIFLLGIGIIVYHIIMATRNKKNPFILIKESELSLDYYGYEKSMLYRRTLAPKKEEKKKNEKVEPTFDEVDDSDRYWEVDEAREDKTEGDVPFDSDKTENKNE